MERANAEVCQVGTSSGRLFISPLHRRYLPPYIGDEYMHRRAFLGLLGSGGVLSTAGCTGTSETDTEGQGTEPEFTTPKPSATSTTTVPQRVREWATDAESQEATRPNGAPVSTDRTITDEPGYNQDELEYFPENQTVRYISLRSGGRPAGYDTWTFNEWGRIESAEIGARRASEVTASRLGVEGLGGGMSSPPDESEGLVIIVRIKKVLDRDGKVVSWPVATFPDLLEAAPRSVDVTLTIEGDTYTRTVPVYASYSVPQYV
jgi:hypothetical protein